jgi:catechol 2,3-dioxygenase-like lactoylglutathione lyase family enzyme
MALKSVIGVDHVVVAVRDLEAASAAWARLGFTVSPPGLHSPHMGTGNYTIMFGDDYLELIGVVAETDQNLPTRTFLAQREGIERTAFTASDAAAGVEELRSRGLTPIGPVQFNRPVDLGHGKTGEAKFSVFRWPLDQQPAGMRIFACQHHTRNTVWIPELQKHANAATRIIRIELLSPAPQADAALMGQLTDQPVIKEADGSFKVASGSTRADFVFLDRAGLAKRYPSVPLDGLPKAGAVGLVIATSNHAATAKALSQIGVQNGELITVAPELANGVVVSFLTT